VEVAKSWVHREMEQLEKTLIACCVLHSFELDLMVRTNIKVSISYPIGNDGVWLDGHTANSD
jgi:hypothetical protein